MRYIVIKPFSDITGFKVPGEPIELNDDRASKLRRHGLIGGKYIEQAVKAEPVEKAVREVERIKHEPIETRKHEKKVR